MQRRRHWMPRPHPEAVWAVHAALSWLTGAGIIEGPLPSRNPAEALLDRGQEVADDDALWGRVPKHFQGVNMTREEVRDFLRLGLSQCYALG